MANLIALDVGTKRIGVASASSTIKIAIPLTTVDVDGSEIDAIKKIVADESVEMIVVGYPRNQSGEATEQTGVVEVFTKQLDGIVPIVFQDESLTSVMAEDRLKAAGKPYEKADIDKNAAAIILQDYLERHHAA